MIGQRSLKDWSDQRVIGKGDYTRFISRLEAKAEDRRTVLCSNRQRQR
jgi:hypothetical protein